LSEQKLERVKITIEAYGEKYTLEFSDELVMIEFLEVLKKISCLVGFHPDAIMEYLEPEEWDRKNPQD
jgi:predicted P-loop ATPase